MGFLKSLEKRSRYIVERCTTGDTCIRSDEVIGNRNHTEERGLSSGVENCAARGDV